MDLSPNDVHGSRVDESETVFVESDTLSDTGKTKESNVDVTIESDHEEINENVNTETRRPKARGRWRKRVRSLFKVFTCCVKQSQ